MTTMIINEEAFEQIINSLDGFVHTDKNFQEAEILREQFRTAYTKERIDHLTKEDYFAGFGRKQGCLAYDLEWGTGLLGSIKGGSKYKYGYEADFPKIKSLIQKIIVIDSESAYQKDGAFLNDLKQVAKLSKDIHGFKTGRTVIPKLLSIYYPKIFLPIFNDQDRFISKLLSDGIETEKTGLELYLEYNFKLLKIKEELEKVTGRKFENFEYSRLLYHTFPKAQSEIDNISTANVGTVEEQKFEALEVQHYQSLLHRNFQKLFPKLKYFDEEEQKPKNGQYDTQTVGIMDILAVDEKGNFVVIEIKRQATDKTIGQILRYMGWTQEELCKDGKKVTGLIVAERKDTQLEFALKVVPIVKFLKLGLTITLNEE